MIINTNMSDLKKITEEDIQETFYNLLLDTALSASTTDTFEFDRSGFDMNSKTTIRFLISSILKYLCINYDRIVTIRGSKITLQTVPSSYKDLFKMLEKLRSQFMPGKSSPYNPEMYYEEIIDKIEQKQMFAPMIEKVKVFFKECTDIKESKHNNNNSSVKNYSLGTNIVSIAAIRETFYNIMAERTI